MFERRSGRRAEHIELPPTAEQLSRLAGMVIHLAREQNHFRSGIRYENSRFFRPSPIEVVSIHDQTGNFLRTEHNLVGHIRRIAPSREYPRRSWSLRMGESIWQAPEDDLSQTRGVATMYSFEWDDRKTHKALKDVRHKPTQDVPEISDQLDAFTLADDAAFVLALEQEMRQVTAADVDLLESHVGEFCERSSLRNNTRWSRR